MFRPAPMLRLQAVVLETDARTVLRELGRRGFVELLHAETDLGKPCDRTAGVAQCDRLLERASELRGTLQLPPTARIADLLDSATAESLLHDIEMRAADLTNRRAELVRRQSMARADAARVAGLTDLDIPLDLAGRSEFLHFVVGSLPDELLATAQREAGPETLILPQMEADGRRAVLAIAPKKQSVEIDGALGRFGFQPADMPSLPGATASSYLTDRRREEEQAAAGLAEVEAERQAMAPNAAQTLDRIEGAVRTERNLLEAERHLAQTERTVLLSGWVPAADFDEVRRAIEASTGMRCVVHGSSPDTTPEDEIPVMPRPPRVLRPFGMLVSAFGLPRYRELEPTLFFALSYILMFGLMFGDLGHGLVLALGGIVLWRTGRSAKLRDAGVLLLYAGVASSLFGLVFGSLFGIPSFKSFALWRDPLEGDPLRLMYVAIGVGIVMISLGLLLNIVNRIRRGDLLGGLFDKFGVAGLVFYWGAIALISGNAALRARGLSAALAILLLAVPVLCWLLKGPLELMRARGRGPVREGLAMAVAESAVEAFEGVLVYLANTISFVRLAAYAMSHAALLTAFFMMADAVRTSTATGSLAIIVLGNIVALVLEGVIAAVQALRLEYYEFFGKFFSGAGRPFRPFTLSSPTT